MMKSNDPCVQALSMQACDGLLRAVDRIARDRMTDICHMHTNLMRPACFQAQFQPRETPQTLQHSVMRHRTTCVSVCYAHLLAVILASSDRRIDGPFIC